MKSAFMLQHYYELESCGCDEIKLIGLYSTKEKAESAIARLIKQPGFKQRPNDFHIEEYKFNEDHSKEGYGTIQNEN